MTRCPDDLQAEQAVSQPTEEWQSGSREIAVERSHEHREAELSITCHFPLCDNTPLHSNSGGLVNVCSRSEKAQSRHGGVDGSSQSRWQEHVAASILLRGSGNRELGLELYPGIYPSRTTPWEPITSRPYLLQAEQPLDTVHRRWRTGVRTHNPLWGIWCQAIRVSMNEIRAHK